MSVNKNTGKVGEWSGGWWQEKTNKTKQSKTDNISGDRDSSEYINCIKTCEITRKKRIAMRKRNFVKSNNKTIINKYYNRIVLKEE